MNTLLMMRLRLTRVARYFDSFLQCDSQNRLTKYLRTVGKPVLLRASRTLQGSLDMSCKVGRHPFLYLNLMAL